MRIMAESFPGAFAGYQLSVVESHQRNKADTSGTAREVVQSFQRMGVDFKEVSFRSGLLVRAGAGSAFTSGVVGRCPTHSLTIHHCHHPRTPPTTKQTNRARYARCATA